MSARRDTITRSHCVFWGMHMGAKLYLCAFITCQVCNTPEGSLASTSGDQKLAILGFLD